MTEGLEERFGKLFSKRLTSIIILNYVELLILSFYLHMVKLLETSAENAYCRVSVCQTVDES